MGIYENARRQTRAKITNAFWQLYKEEDLGRITVKRIAALAGIHRATFYLHFEDVHHVLREIEDELMTSLDQSEGESAKFPVDIDQIGREQLALFEKQAEYLHVLVKERRDPAFATRYRQRLCEKILSILLQPDVEQSPRAQAVINVAISSIVDDVVNSADESALSLSDFSAVLEGFITRGYYRTMSDFGVAGLKPLSFS